MGIRASREFSSRLPTCSTHLANISSRALTESISSSSQFVSSHLHPSVRITKIICLFNLPSQNSYVIASS